MIAQKNGRPAASRVLRQTTIAASVALAALAGMAPSPAQSQTIKIGVPVPLSGSSANAGTDILNGAKLAAAKVNAAGGVLGKQIELVPEDDACDAQTAVQAAQKLVDAGVVAVAGGYCSSAALPELTTFHRAGIPYVLDASTNPKLTEMGYDNVFRTIGRDDEQGPFAASFMKNSLHAKRAAVINDNTTYAKGLADNTVAALKKDGVEVVYDDAITPGQMDYSPTLTHVASLKPDVIYYTGYFSEAGLLVKEARQLGLKMTLMGGDGTNDPTLMKTAGPAANDMIITTAPLAQFLSGAHSFVDDYTKAYGQGPGPYSVYEYDAVGVTAKAIADAKSATPAAITAALHKISNYQGATGTIGFNPKGDRSVAVYITIIVRGDNFAPYQKQDAAGHWMAMK
ncbi:MULTISPECIES: branched-chain amino acid ABC transporter substrate-binding protein [Paraburkholderia]|jgi:ABC-type branched-subunit amino acid transport system substrate-binding protein|uniref:ABC transporter substrate-binding protein n=1 Tax=Paraburkholderia madseniana TaxID=2599607 RepID=A0A6N6WFD6_9BURK|nr:MULTISPECIES: branched-chain amino acid ABC transporter substrate-binding protein [Paraburkholderia]KAE8758811.1 ABC transporter substrate-binding protein [Paraburkholderia madseniana]MCX4147980.1 branched-chain amino acid ABC transporter substrate-binding protein [Paraburkholderia madseniana]MCX4175705.1 branched-chain amino acid ABC transporter substrate-binding protein [Paraburkholderia madseniana]MDN7150920.1 branched-chain amino acid ABC transporter substrate-binding protein [Paraburkho